MPLGHLGEAQESGRELEQTGERILGQSYVGVGCGQSSCGGGVCPGRQDGGWREKFQCLQVCVITRGAFPKRGRCWEVKNLRPGKLSFSKGGVTAGVPQSLSSALCPTWEVEGWIIPKVLPAEHHSREPSRQRHASAPPRPCSPPASHRILWVCFGITLLELQGPYVEGNSHSFNIL